MFTYFGKLRLTDMVISITPRDIYQFIIIPDILGVKKIIQKHLRKENNVKNN